MPNDKPLTSVNAIEAYSIPSELPMLVTSDVVIYPLMAAPLLFGRRTRSKSRASGNRRRAQK